jgi:hypothetical protein
MKRILASLLMSLVAFAPAARSAPINLAPFGTATASSAGYGTVFADAIDGNRDGEFNNGSVWHSTGHPEENPPTFYQVDLGGDFYLDRVEIFPRNVAQGSVRNFRLTVLDAANVQVFSQDYFTGAGESTSDTVWATNALRNVLGQTIRIQRLSQDPAPLSFMTMAEFEVYGDSTPIQPNLALGKPVTANTGGGFGTALSDAVDGFLDGNYGHNDGTANSHPIFHADSNRGDEYWQVDLGSVQNLDYLNVFSRSDFGGNTSNVRLDVLGADGSTSVYSLNMQLQGIDHNGPRFDQTVDLTNVSGQFIRLTALEGGGDHFLAMAEVEAFGVAVPEPNTLVLGGIAIAIGIVYRRRRACA